MPKLSSDALREAFVSHGQLQGMEFTELPPGTSIVDVRRSLYYIVFECDSNTVLYMIHWSANYTVITVNSGVITL